ncbi:MAG: GNAT family N-acetyltransferase [Flavihumibacter sp.]
MGAIQYLTRREIDTGKWNDCIRQAANSLLYGYSWWLDHLAPGWHALVLDNYEAVMPLTWRQKFGVRYLFQPLCTASLGVFYRSPVNVPAVHFLQAIPSSFRYWNIALNEENHLTENRFPVQQRQNQLLSLSEGYAAVSARYSRLVKRKLEKATRSNLLLQKGVAVNTIIDWYARQYPGTGNPADYPALIAGCETAVANGSALTYAAETPDGERMGYYIVLHDGRFAYSLIGGSTPEGKNRGVFYFLTDAAIRDSCERAQDFRFEGSDKEGIAFFNRQFGAAPVYYPQIRYNALPLPLRWLKK